jgi:hypothetical protein
MPRFADMPTTGSHDVFAERRQTPRVQISMPVLVRRAGGNGVFLEEARTVAVNSQGCVLWLTAEVGREDQLTVVNASTAEEAPCTVAYVGLKQDAKTEIGLKFVQPAPRFWNIAFPPNDWNPDDRKRPEKAQPSPYGLK